MFLILASCSSDIENTKDSILNSWENISKDINNKEWEWNTFNNSFNKSKKILEKDVFNSLSLERKSMYCGCDYTEDKKVISESCWFVTSWKYTSRWEKIEWEHVVPAENFWRSFVEWRDGDSECVDSKWKFFNWRNCARKVNENFRLMEADMYNLLPVIWEVNWLRSNYNIAMLSSSDYNFWKCSSKIQKWSTWNNEAWKFEPRDEIKGWVARVYLYMDYSYPKANILWNKTKQLVGAWNKMYPTTEKECNWYKNIKKVQGNENIVLKELCK